MSSPKQIAAILIEANEFFDPKPSLEWLLIRAAEMSAESERERISKALGLS